MPINFGLTVTPSTSPGLTLATPTAQTVMLGSSLSFNVGAMVPPGDSVQFGLDGAPAGASINPNTGLFTWTPPTSQGAGVYTFYATVSDPYGGFDEEPFSVSVIDPNTGLGQTGQSLSTALPVSPPTGNTTTFAGPYALGSGASGAEDVTLYSFTLLAGQTLNANVLANQIGLSNLTSYLRVFGAGGSEMANSGGSSGPDASLTFVAPADGTYYLGISGASNSAYNPNVPGSGAASSTGAYQLQLSVTPSSSPGLTLAPPVNQFVALGSTLSFTVGALVPPGDTAQFGLERAPSGASINPNTGQFTWTPPSGQGPGVYTFFVNVSDPYGGFDEQPLTIAVFDPSRGSDQTGESLSTALPVFLSENTPTTLAGPYALGNGAYGAQDVDLFSLSLRGGQTLSANVLAGQIGLSNLFSDLRVFDANGNQLAATGGNPDAALTFTATADGTYYLGVSGAPNSSYNPLVPGSGVVGSTGAYQLQLTTV